MKYHGYRIVKAKHPTPLNPNRYTYDIMDGDNVRKTNIASIETAKHVIEIMCKWGHWVDKSNPDRRKDE